MMSDAIYGELNKLRDEYRMRMNRCSDGAAKAAQEDNMTMTSMLSTESERCREAFVALNRAIQIIDNAAEA